jgi:uncharacterized protein with PIN domain
VFVLAGPERRSHVGGSAFVNAPRFVVDVMLGRLAHWLRAMGYDTVYDGRADDDRLLALSIADDRILITRDASLATAAGRRGCLIRIQRT